MSADGGAITIAFRTSANSTCFAALFRCRESPDGACEQQLSLTRTALSQATTSDSSTALGRNGCLVDNNRISRQRGEFTG